MSKFFEISKRVGWVDQVIEVPPIDKLIDLRKKVLADNCEKSYEEIMRINRFAEIPDTIEGLKAMRILNETWLDGKKIFVNL